MVRSSRNTTPYNPIGYNGDLKDHPFLEYIEFLNEDIDTNNWEGMLFQLIRSMPYEQIADRTKDLVPTKDDEGNLSIIDTGEGNPQITLSPFGDELNYKNFRRLQTEIQETVDAFLYWHDTSDSRLADGIDDRNYLKETGAAILPELSDEFPGLEFNLITIGVGYRVLFDLIDFLTYREWPNILARCAYPRCKRFFQKRRVDQKYCSSAHRKSHWQETR